MKYLNLGCGNRFHPAWINVDFVSTGAGVIAHNLNEGIPFPDNSFDVVYHSHVLEHFAKDDAPGFLKECYRVLKPGGIIRMVIPDLEQIVRVYLLALEEAEAGSQEWQQNYDWIMLELLDQTVRNKSGGNMKSYLANPDLSNQQFILGRCGREAESILETNKSKNLSGNLNKYINKAGRVIKNPFLIVSKSKDLIHIPIKAISGKNYERWRIGKFRQGGEIHQWMYDRFSLKRLLYNQGFESVILRQPNESYIEGWLSFHLDTEPDGRIYKPDSLFMEAKKPF